MKTLIMIISKTLNRILPKEDSWTFYGKNYTISFKGLTGINVNFWGNVCVIVEKILDDNSTKGVAYYPKQSNSWTKLNPIRKYYSCYRKVENGKVINVVPDKKDIKAFRKAVYYFPFIIKMEKYFND